MNQILKPDLNNDPEDNLSYSKEIKYIYKYLNKNYWKKEIKNTIKRKLYNNNNNNNNSNSNIYNKRKIFKYQFFISLFLIIVIGTFISTKNIYLNKQEKYSNELLNNYNITKLYSSLSDNNYLDYNNNNNNYSSIIGIIDIPTIDLYYPIFGECDEDLLKIAPCKFNGPDIGEVGNVCIAGHNYDNNKFFSRISTLNKNDYIYLYNKNNKKFSYKVSDIYEVREDDLSPIYTYNKKYKQLTLITCNNINKNRIIVKSINRD